MGCGASVPKPASPEQKEEMCGLCCKLMSVVCVEAVLKAAIEDPENKGIKIVAPTDTMTQLRSFSSELRNGAAPAAEGLAEAGEAIGDQAEGLAAKAAEKVGGGMLGGMLNKAAGAVAAVTDKAGELAGGLTAKTFTLLADGLDKPIDLVDQKFTEVSQEVVVAKKVEIVQLYNEVIMNQPIFHEPGFPGTPSTKATKLVRGQEPTGETPDYEAAYKACPGDSVTKAFGAATEASIVDKILPAVTEAVASSKFMTAWNDCIAKYNEANKKLGEYEATAKFKKDEVQLDVNRYIAQEIAKGLVSRMGVEETAIRPAPAGKAKQNIETFSRCFSGTPLLKTHFDEFKAGK